MSDEPFDELPDFTEDLTDGSLELPGEEPSEVSLEAADETTTATAAVAEAEAPAEKRQPGWLVTSFNVYNGMLLIALVALFVGTLLLALEWARYGFTLGPPNR